MITATKAITALGTPIPIAILSFRESPPPSELEDPEPSTFTIFPIAVFCRFVAGQEISH